MLWCPQRCSWPLLAAVLHAAGPVHAPITGCLDGVDACSCEWAADDTDRTTLAGLSHPGDFTAAQISATGLTEAVIKAADSSPQACERVCCESLLITDAPAAAQAPAQTGACGVWQHGGGTGAVGCWLGLDNTQRKPPLPVNPNAPGGVWKGGAGRLCLISSSDPPAAAAPAAAAQPQVPAGVQVCRSNWGEYVLCIAVVAVVVYLSAGVAIGFQRGGGGRVGSLRLTLHPHYALWRQLAGLVLDGAAYAGGGGSGSSAKKISGAHSRELRDDGEDAASDRSGSVSGRSGRSGKSGKSGSSKRSDKKSGKKDKRLKGSKGSKAGGEAGLGQPLADGEPMGHEERWQARQLEEIAQQGVHSSQAKVSVVGQ